MNIPSSVRAAAAFALGVAASAITWVVLLSVCAAALVVHGVYQIAGVGAAQILGGLFLFAAAWFVLTGVRRA